MAVLLATSHVAGAVDPARLEDPVLQQRYSDLTQQLRCLQCQGETVADTQADFAREIRRQVREMLVAGKSDAEVRQYFVDRYGETILARPRWIWLWVAPALLLGLGLIVASRILRQRRQLLATDTSEPGDEEPRT